MHERVEQLKNMQREGVLKNIPKDKVKTKYLQLCMIIPNSLRYNLWSVATSILYKKSDICQKFS